MPVQTISTLFDPSAAADGTACGNGALTPSAALTASRIGTGTPTWGGIITQDSAMTIVNNPFTARPFCSFKISATTYDLSAIKSFKSDLTIGGPCIGLGSLGLAVGQGISLGYLFKTNLINTTAGTNRIDSGVVSSTGGAGGAATGYGQFALTANNLNNSWNAEGTDGGTTSGTAIRPAVANKEYWISLRFIPRNGNVDHQAFRIRVVDALTWELIGETTCAQADTASIGSFLLGNNAVTSVFATGMVCYYGAPVAYFGDLLIGEPETPGQPTGLSASAISSSRIDLSWTNVDTKFSNIQIVRNGAIIGNTNSETATTYSDTTCQPNTAYTYAVQGWNVRGPGTASSTSAATTAAGNVVSRGFARKAFVSP